MKWSLVDQAIVSAGTFISNIILARALEPEAYGVFALLFGGMLGLQIVNATLLFHPISIRLITGGDARSALVATSITLTAILSIGLSCLLFAGMVVTGFGELVVPATAWFFAWQIQEGLRRSLLSLFRHREACLGDAFSYGGQALAVIALSASGVLSLELTLWCMAATSALAALIQFMQLTPVALGRMTLRTTVADFWAVGGFWALGSGLFSHFRVLLVPWSLAVAGGPAAAAGFQAAINVISLLNPLFISVGNVVPQAVAEAKSKGLLRAWHVARSYGILAFPLISVYGLLLLLFPRSVLELFYGSQSSYGSLGSQVQLLFLATLLAFLGEIALFFLWGIAAVRLNFLINAVATATAIVVTPVAVYGYGLTGGCMALIAVNAGRLVLIHVVMRRLLATDGLSAASVAPTTNPQGDVSCLSAVKREFPQ